MATAHQTLTLNDTDPISYGFLGLVYLFQKQHKQARSEMERAIDFNPSLADHYALLAETLSLEGRTEDALRLVEEALRRKPFFADGHLYTVGFAYYLAGKPHEAIAPPKQYPARYPNTLGAHLALAAVYSELGREAEARAEAVEVLRINPIFSLEVHKERAPIKDPAMLEQHIAALRKAGLK